MNNSTSDLYSLYWSNHTRNLKNCFDIFRCDNELVDVTLSCEGRKLKAHKIVLSACSSYFLDLFRDNPCQHPIIIMRDIKYQIMVDILSFMYQGEVNVDIEHLNCFLKTAEVLQVKGLVEDPSSSNLSSSSNSSSKTYLPDDELQLIPVPEETTRKIKQKNCMETDSVVDDHASPLKRFKDNELNNYETISIDGEKDDMMQETMDIVKTESESEDNANDFLDLTLIANTEHNHHEIISSHDSKNAAIQRSLINSISKDGFPCRYCDKIFSHPNSLKLHLPSHSGSTSCGLCQAVLSRKYELKVHMRKKHNIELN